jgi:hypothetical protein
VLAVVRNDLLGAELAKSKIRNLDHPATVYQTVRGLQVPVVLHRARVNVDHPLEKKQQKKKKN